MFGSPYRTSAEMVVDKMAAEAVPSAYPRVLFRGEKHRLIETAAGTLTHERLVSSKDILGEVTTRWVVQQQIRHKVMLKELMEGLDEQEVYPLLKAMIQHINNIESALMSAGR